MADVLETLKKLPEFCYHILPSSGEPIGIQRGVPGHVKVAKLPAGVDTVEKANELLGVTKAQAEAMLVGSMFGWHVSGADPDRYDPETGKPKTGAGGV